MATLVLTDEQKVSLSISFLDAEGNPTTVTEVPVWTVSDPALLAVTPSADGLSAEVTTVGPLGTGQVTVSVTGSDIQGTLTGVLDVQVIGSAAASIAITAGTPEHK